MNRPTLLALLIAIGVAPLATHAATFVPTSGNHFWNDNNNWGPAPPQPFPNAPGASAIIPSPTGPLTIDLGEAITVATLQIQKPSTPNSGNTTITGANTLTFAGPPAPSLDNRSGTGTGVSVIDVPLLFNATLTVNQESNEQLRLTQNLSGSGGLTLNRLIGGPAGARLIVLTAANSYGGATAVTNAAGGDDLMVIRLNNAGAIPAGSNISVGGSSVLEIASGSFTRGLTGPGAVSFTGAGRNGFSAVDATRTINLGGGAAPVTWGNAAGQANFGQLVLGTTTANAMVDFVNPLDLGTANRNIRSYDGTGPIDGRISGNITGNRQITKLNDGVLSFAGTNTYSNGTRIEEGMLRLDSAGALPASGNVVLGQGATLGIGADTAPGDPNADFARTLGSGSGQIQLIAIGNAGNQANAGLSAHNGNRSVVFNGGGTLTWGTNFFLSGMNMGTPNRNLILSNETADGTLNLKNPIDLNGANRTITTRNGSADFDGELSGVLSGTGGLIKENSGTLVLTNNNTYDGTTTVAQGRLLINNLPLLPGDSGTGADPVVVNNSGTLGGVGSIAGTVTLNAGGHIAPGASIESLDVGGIIVETGSFLDFELGAPNGIAGVNNDLLTVLGTTTINGVGTVNVSDAGGMGLGRYTLIDYADFPTGPGVGSFVNQTPNGPAGFSYRLINTGSTIDLVVAIPEPSTLALLSLAALFVMQRRCRWRCK